MVWQEQTFKQRIFRLRFRQIHASVATIAAFVGRNPMTGIETNIFPIENLSELSSVYRVYRIRGLAKEHPQYFQNRQIVARKLSYALKSPVSVIEFDGQPHLILRDDAPEPDSPFPLVRATIYFDRVPGVRQLDFTVRSPENDAISLR